jgi:hypothetical protein
MEPSRTEQIVLWIIALILAIALVWGGQFIFNSNHAYSGVVYDMKFQPGSSSVSNGVVNGKPFVSNSITPDRYIVVVQLGDNKFETLDVSQDRYYSLSKGDPILVVCGLISCEAR